ncbi:hypothetical protein [Photorhabdus viridis]|uniref:hypothetical protein n=1 Tax=Photorhabdus viridis TaxID=3163327 RepID=UPI003307A2FA
MVSISATGSCFDGPSDGLSCCAYDEIVVKALAEQTAAHTHHNTGTPENASAIRNTAYKSDGLK